LLLLKEKGPTYPILFIHYRPHTLTAFLKLALALVREVRPHNQKQDPSQPAGPDFVNHRPEVNLYYPSSSFWETKALSLTTEEKKLKKD